MQSNTDQNYLKAIHKLKMVGKEIFPKNFLSKEVKIKVSPADKKGEFSQQKTTLLTRLNISEKSTVIGIYECNKHFLRYLYAIGVQLGSFMQVEYFFTCNKSIKINHNTVVKNYDINTTKFNVLKEK